jgi:ring-1,2-phenylacetyl-CoA epoxidase subunit PaaD
MKSERIPDHLFRRQIADILRTVHDPEIPGLSIVDLGMVIDIYPVEEHWRIDLAPTYSGCPAIDVIPILTKIALQEGGIMSPEVEMIISPPWSTDWISEEGKEKLLAWGIAPPGNRNAKHGEGIPRQCPQCGYEHVTLISAYGSTPCKAMYRCDQCLETFDYFKCY